MKLCKILTFCNLIFCDHIKSKTAIKDIKKSKSILTMCSHVGADCYNKQVQIYLLKIISLTFSNIQIASTLFII